MFDKKLLGYIALGSSIGTSLVVPVLIGILGGTYLDNHFQTDPWLSLAGVLLGLVLGVTSIVQIIRKIERSEKQ